jgi:hypothetical protein
MIGQGMIRACSLATQSLQRRDDGISAAGLFRAIGLPEGDNASIDALSISGGFG